MVFAHPFYVTNPFYEPLHVHVQPMIRALPTFLLRPIVHFVGWLGCCLGLSVPALGVKPFPFGTCIVTSVGSMGMDTMDTAFAPHTPWAHVPLLVMVGAVADKAVARNGQAVVRPTLTLTCTLDHRFADGSAAAHVAKRIRTFIENPVSTHVLFEGQRRATKGNEGQRGLLVAYNGLSWSRLQRSSLEGTTIYRFIPPSFLLINTFTIV